MVEQAKVVYELAMLASRASWGRHSRWMNSRQLARLVKWTVPLENIMRRIIARHVCHSGWVKAQSAVFG